VQDIKRNRVTKKHLLIAVVSVLVAGLLVTAVLVGIRLVTENELEIVKVDGIV